MKDSAPNTLVLYSHYTDKLSYYDDWKHAFETHPDFSTSSININDRSNLALAKNSIRDFDLIVLLHSTNADTLQQIRPYTDVLNSRTGVLLSFVGNEVNLPRISLKEKIDFLKDISAEYIGTQLPVEAGRWLYEECASSRVVELPHALNPESFRPEIPLDNRPIDIGARSTRYWSCLGDNERNDLFDFFSHHSFIPPIVVDIDTKNRLDRTGWAGFLNNCKGTISNEAGSYYLERDDATIRRIQEYVITNQKQDGSHIVRPDSLPEKLWNLMPQPVKALLRYPLNAVLNSFRVKYYSDVYEDLEFPEIFERFFRNTPRCPAYSKAISSRHFDAIGTKTCQIMLKGRYNGILNADEHYIALEHDFSNIESVMQRFHDKSYRHSLVERTYEYIMDQHTYYHRITAVRELV
ncbi:MAG TPA: hypothetical protein PLM29_00665 [Deltaproteobacteria bacterium]|nr:hypothetical protein [Deltaproteobacteria bacterium]